MNLFDLFVKIGVDDQASRNVEKISEKLGNGLKTAAKVGTAAIAAASTAIIALTKSSIDAYKEYEQLVGGVETLFKDSADTVQQYAANAYKTAGMSANEYMSTVTSFSASLLQSLGNNTEAAAEYANQALTDMSDNANKMGTDMSLIQNAYQGFAKANFTMLDNLKLGYGGTQSEMQRLITDAAKLSDTVDAQDMSFANIVKAINVVQTEMGITGTTAKEAASTIQGSVASMKSSWSNLVTGIADENANLDVLVTNFVESIGTVAQNIVPKIGVALNGVTKLIQNLIPVIVQEIPKLVEENLPVLADAAVGTITYLAKSIVDLLPKIVELGLDLIVSLANGITESIPTLVPTIVDVVLQIVNTLTNPETLKNLLNAALDIVVALTEGLLSEDSINALVDAVVALIENIVEFLVDPENIEKLWDAGVKIVVAILNGMLKANAKIKSSIPKLVKNIIDQIKETDWLQVGKDVVDGILSGIKKTWDNIVNWVKDSLSNLVDGIGDLFGGDSESKANVDGSHRSGLDYVPYDGYIAELHKGERVLTASEARGYGGTTIGDVYITIDGANYSDEDALATAIAEKLQEMTDRKAAVYV